MASSGRFLQVYFGARAVMDDTVVASLETDADSALHRHRIPYYCDSRHGLPRDAGARHAEIVRPLRSAVAMVLLALLHGAAAARGLGSLIANEGHFDEGYWTMTVGGTLALLVMTIFIGYVLWNPKAPAGDEIPLAERGP